MDLQISGKIIFYVGYGSTKPKAEQTCMSSLKVPYFQVDTQITWICDSQYVWLSFESLEILELLGIHYVQIEGYLEYGEEQKIYSVLEKIDVSSHTRRHSNIWLNYCFLDEERKKIKIPVSQKQSLGSELKTKLCDEQHLDVSLQCKDGELKANQFMLCVRSKVFEKMLNESFVEAESKVVQCNFSKQLMSALLDYIYTDQMDFENIDAKEMFFVADYYELLNLKDLCGIAIFNGITFENAISTLIFANEHKLPDLRNILLFIRINHKKVFEQKELQHSQYSMPGHLLQLLLSMSSNE